MENIYINHTLKPSAASPNRPGPLGTRAKGTGRSCWGPAVLGLGLLCVGLLAGLLFLGVRYSVAVKDLSVTQSELKEQHKELSNLKRNQTCPEGWRKFENACYYHSVRMNTWNNSRNDCMAKGGDLVVIDSSQEQKFLSEYKGWFWIGLTDLEHEGTWKWVDGEPLILSYWGEGQPDNQFYKEEENCAHIIPIGWNDYPCDHKQRWICEASPEDAQISKAQ